MERKTMTCVFCEHPDIKARTVLENDLAWVFPSFYPIVPVHLLVCPKRCVKTYDQLTKDEREAMFELMTRLKPALARAYGAVGFNYAWNEAPAAGQTVPHMHIHFVPRRANDKQELGFDPKDHFYRADVEHPLTEEQIGVLTQEIQEALRLV